MISLRQRLSFRQAKISIFIGIILGLLLSAVQIFADLRRVKEHIDPDTLQVISIVQQLASRAAYDLDKSLAQTVVAGLFKYRPIIEVQIKDDFNRILAHQQRVSALEGGTCAQWSSQWSYLLFPVKKDYPIPLKKEGQLVGELLVVVDTHYVFLDFFERSRLVILAGLLRNLLLSILLTLLFHALVTRPLFDIVAQLTKIDPNNGEEKSKKFLIGSKTHQHDELGLLLRTVNRLLQKFYSNREQLQEREKHLVFQNRRRKESEVRLKSIFDSSPDLLLLLDLEQKITYQNRASDIVGELFSEPLFHTAWIQAIDTQALQIFQVELKEDYWWEVRLAPMHYEEGMISVLMDCRDITEKIDLEQQNIRNARLATLGVLSASVAHEINNPNHAIRFNSMIFDGVWQDIAPILKRLQKEEGAFYLGGLPVTEALESVPVLLSDVQEATRRIETIIGNLNQMGVQEEQGDVAQIVPVNRVLSSALSLLQGQIKKYTDQFHYYGFKGEPKVRGNYQQLEQVIINIIVNALQSLTRRSQSVYVKCLLDMREEKVVIQVRDEGRGIEAKHLLKLTEPFFTTKKKEGSTGLGLSICHTIVENHRGKMEIVSEKGVGTLVIVRLPLFFGDTK
ncbi:ATP-binding protein [Magnetococcales bacterium HHB-1]